MTVINDVQYRNLNDVNDAFIIVSLDKYLTLQVQIRIKNLVGFPAEVGTIPIDYH